MDEETKTIYIEELEVEVEYFSPIMVPFDMALRAYVLGVTMGHALERPTTTVLELNAVLDLMLTNAHFHSDSDVLSYSLTGALADKLGALVDTEDPSV